MHMGHIIDSTSMSGTSLSEDEDFDQDGGWEKRKDTDYFFIFSECLTLIRIMMSKAKLITYHNSKQSDSLKKKQNSSFIVKLALV